jgi:tripartite-type tricarboxylate transporter receptor subunit TctC
MKVKARDIPFKGAGETPTPVLGKHGEINVRSVPLMFQHSQSGRTNCVLFSSADRIASLPSASSLRDLGIPNEELILWRGVLAPKGTPPAKIAELEAGFEKAANAPATRKFLDDAGEQLLIRKGPALRQYIDTEYEALGKLAKALNLSPQ